MNLHLYGLYPPTDSDHTVCAGKGIFKPGHCVLKTLRIQSMKAHEIRALLKYHGAINLCAIDQIGRIKNLRPLMTGGADFSSVISKN